MTRFITTAIFTAMMISAPAHAGQGRAGNLAATPEVSKPLGYKNNTAVLKDLYCKNNSPNYVPCNSIFKAYCALKGGTMSKQQGWGGQTCWEPS